MNTFVKFFNIFLIFSIAIAHHSYAGKKKNAFRAVKTGDSTLVEEMIKIGYNFNISDRDGETPLMFTCGSRIVGMMKIARLLIQSGVDINAKNDGGWTALFYAVANSNTEAVKLLIEKGADVNVKSDSRSYPISFSEVQEIRDILVQAGAILPAGLSSRVPNVHFVIRRGNRYDIDAAIGSLSINRKHIRAMSDDGISNLKNENTLQCSYILYTLSVSESDSLPDGIIDSITNVRNITLNPGLYALVCASPDQDIIEELPENSNGSHLYSIPKKYTLTVFPVRDSTELLIVNTYTIQRCRPSAGDIAANITASFFRISKHYKARTEFVTSIYKIKPAQLVAQSIPISVEQITHFSLADLRELMKKGLDCNTLRNAGEVEGVFSRADSCIEVKLSLIFLDDLSSWEKEKLFTYHSSSLFESKWKKFSWTRLSDMDSTIKATVKEKQSLGLVSPVLLNGKQIAIWIKEIRNTHDCVPDIAE